MDGVEAIESTLARVLKPRGFRKGGCNWFRTTSADLYQVVNLQKSSWGGGNCYLNLAGTPSCRTRAFVPSISAV